MDWNWSLTSSFLATVMLIRSIPSLIPPQVHEFISYCLKYYRSLNPTMSILINEPSLQNDFYNNIYESIETYLSSKCFSSANVIKMSTDRSSNSLLFAMAEDQSIEETFDGFKLRWSLRASGKDQNKSGDNQNKSNYYELSFYAKHKDAVQTKYIPHVLKEAADITLQNRNRRLFSNREESGVSISFWSSIPFLHPSTFNSIAIDPHLKEGIKNDLLKFVNQSEFYDRVGRAWKRGYLLYGPPGTGKTSLIAAIANFLEFDVYDLELTSVMSNIQLRKLLVSTSSKAVIVVEDVDCMLDLSDRRNGKKRKSSEMEGVGSGSQDNKHSRVTLSGVLNFMDGLWSPCGGERLMIFTTNHKENLDPALLRPGRIDKEISLSYCEFMAFKTLVKNYLDIEDHELMKEVEVVLPSIQITPADIAEFLMGFNEDPDLAMRNVLEEMKKRQKKDAQHINKEVNSEEETQVVKKSKNKTDKKMIPRRQQTRK
ncbi:AAA-ATPase At3g28510-like [Magnolia sinica]|uniref:AAA-ATPase At3g28510-like n=1 Tax=Magnolia sinica TaxID=86752 RepID=UPI00265A5A4B|nr:AAA-ATPase At3g28510-like [Magnolia sinica]